MGRLAELVMKEQGLADFRITHFDPFRVAGIELYNAPYDAVLGQLGVAEPRVVLDRLWRRTTDPKVHYFGPSQGKAA
jgi:hypothetical protein